MTKLHTHYDNLKVTRNAPPEVIRAAYKTLSQRFHPDKNPGDAESARIMAIINTAYEVLSDPNKRREHDQWIVEMEAVNSVDRQKRQASHATTQNFSHSTGNTTLPKFLQSIFNIINGFVTWVLYYVLVVSITIGVIWLINNADDFFGGKSSLPPDLAPAPVHLKYVRPSTAPNGQPWPTSAGYVKGYQRLHTDGLSTVTVDNSQNDSDVFVKLYSLNGAQAYPIRQFYIPAFSSFTLNKVSAGNYDIRYRDLDNGGLSRSESFNIQETKTSKGTQFSNFTMTLYKVQNGNMQTYDLSEADF